MITTVTLNPAIDRTVVVENFAFGAVNRVRTSREDMGGKGINVARILRSLGTEALATGFIGARNFSHVQNLLDRDGIHYDLVQVPAETRQNTKLVESSSRVTTDINEAGFCVSDASLSKLKASIRNFAAQSDFTVFSGSISPGLTASIYQELIGLLPTSCKAVLDADGEPLLQGLAAHPFLIKPNIHELENALGQALSSHHDIVVATRGLIEEYHIAYALVSMGGNGSILVTRGQALYAPALPASVKGTVGAGDTMLAGFIHSLAIGQSDQEALACATACGALAVSNEGTESISKSSMIALAAQVQLTVIPV